MAEKRYPVIYCIRCREPNTVSIFNLGQGDVVLYSCKTCGIAVESPGKKDLADALAANRKKGEAVKLADKLKQLAKGAQTKSADFCDRCHVPAVIQAVLPSGRDLWLCRHHFRNHAGELVKAGAKVTDHDPGSVL